MSKMTFAEARGRLLQIADEAELHGWLTWADELRDIEKRVARRKAHRKAPVRSQPITPGLERKIRGLRRRYPKLSQQKIGEMVGVNSGRVSEALVGKR